MIYEWSTLDNCNQGCGSATVLVSLPTHQFGGDSAASTALHTTTTWQLSRVPNHVTRRDITRAQFTRPFDNAFVKRFYPFDFICQLVKSCLSTLVVANRCHGISIFNYCVGELGGKVSFRVCNCVVSNHRLPKKLIWEIPLLWKYIWWIKICKVLETIFSKTLVTLFAKLNPHKGSKQKPAPLI